MHIYISRSNLCNSCPQFLDFVSRNGSLTTQAPVNRPLGSWSMPCSTQISAYAMPGGTTSRHRQFLHFHLPWWTDPPFHHLLCRQQAEESLSILQFCRYPVVSVTDSGRQTIKHLLIFSKFTYKVHLVHVDIVFGRLQRASSWRCASFAADHLLSSLVSGIDFLFKLQRMCRTREDKSDVNIDWNM